MRSIGRASCRERVEISVVAESSKKKNEPALVPGSVLVFDELNCPGASGESFFFSSRRRHTSCYRDWSSDVCSSDLAAGLIDAIVELHAARVLRVRHVLRRRRKHRRSEERRVGKECRSRWSPYH